MSPQDVDLVDGPQLAACSTHRREKLCRYIARPALATSRLSVTSTGQVLYKLKRPFRDGIPASTC